MTGPPTLRRPRRPIATLAWALGFFLAAQVGLALLTDTALPMLRDPEFGLRLMEFRQARARHPDSPVVAVLGTSRTAFGLCPEALPPGCTVAGRRPLVFNFSYLGCGPAGELLTLHRLLARGVRPDWVLVECWPPFFAAMHQPEQLKLCLDRLSWSDIRAIRAYSPGKPSTLYDKWWQQRLLPWYTNRQRLLQFLAPAWLPKEAWLLDWYWKDLARDGWLPRLDHTPSREVLQKIRDRIKLEYSQMLAAFQLSPLADRALRDLVARCRRENIRVALYLMPESKTFQALYPPGLWDRMAGYFQDVAREYGVPIFDTRDWAPDTDFDDYIHLVPGGARTFTARFGREILGPLFQGARSGALLCRQ